VSDPTPLTPQQHRAADLLGRNWTSADTAVEVGVSEKTIPNAKATLEAALSATTAKGEPDWAIRVKAAQLLMTTADPSGPPDPADDTRPTFIYVRPDEGEGDADADAR
jgi:hypothetical protein